MQHSGKWNTTSQILKPKNIKLRDINGLTSSQIKKMSVRCRSQDFRAINAHAMGSLRGNVRVCLGGCLACGGFGVIVVLGCTALNNINIKLRSKLCA